MFKTLKEGRSSKVAHARGFGLHSSWRTSILVSPSLVLPIRLSGLLDTNRSHFDPRCTPVDIALANEHERCRRRHGSTALRLDEPVLPNHTGNLQSMLQHEGEWPHKRRIKAQD